MPNPFATIDPETAKKKAKQMQLLLGRQGFALPLGSSLNILSRMCGYSDWNAMSAGIAEKKSPQENRTTRCSPPSSPE